MSDEPIKICPECGEEVRRLIFGGVGVIFKGPGFYVTDRAAGKSAGGKGKTDSAVSVEGDASAAPGEAASVSREGTSAAGGGASTGGDAAKGDSPKREIDPKSGPEHGKAVGSGAQKKNKPAAQTA
jgi:predicted nucleic acid-binding Zn ribbon protein